MTGPQTPRSPQSGNHCAARPHCREPCPPPRLPWRLPSSPPTKRPVFLPLVSDVPVSEVLASFGYRKFSGEARISGAVLLKVPLLPTADLTCSGANTSLAADIHLIESLLLKVLCYDPPALYRLFKGVVLPHRPIHIAARTVSTSIGLLSDRKTVVTNSCPKALTLAASVW